MSPVCRQAAVAKVDLCESLARRTIRGTLAQRCWRRSMSRVMKPSYSWSDRRFLESQRSLSPSCNGRGRRRGFQDHHCRRGKRARMCSSVAPSPLWISKAIGPLQMRHLPTQLAPTRRKLESVSATRPSRSAGVMGTGALRSGSRWEGVPGRYLDDSRRQALREP